MTVAVPPPRTRFWFWAAGRRVEPRYRAWAAEQIASPDFVRRRLWPSLAFQIVLVVVPQTLLAVATHSRWRLIVPAALLAFSVVYAVVVTVRRRPLPDATRRRLLAYHGVTADGTATTPVSARSLLGGNPLGKAGLALLCAQVLVFSSGVAVAADRITAHRACHRRPPADAAALAGFVGRPVLLGAVGLNPPEPVVAPGTRLVAAREVDTGIPGMHYVAAYAPGASGRLFGPAVWRVVDPRSVLNPGTGTAVDALNLVARQITPSTGYVVQSPDRQLDRALDCAETAR